MGFIDCPFADTVPASTPTWTVVQASARDCHVPNTFRSCRSSRLQRLPPQESDPRTRPLDGPRVCCTPQPAVGFATFPIPGRPHGLPRPEGRLRNLPQWRGPFEASSSPGSRTTRHRGPSRGARSPDGVPSRRWTSCAAVRVATVRRLCPRPQGFLPPGEFVACAPRCRDAQLDAPMGFGSTRSDACHARGAPDGRYRPFHPAAPNRSRCPVSREGREGKDSRLRLAPRWADAGAGPGPKTKVGVPPVRLAGSPKTATLPVRPAGSRRSRPGSVAAIQVIPKDGLDPRSAAPRRAPPSADRDPEGFPPCRSVSPEGARSPAVAPRAPKSGAATPARSPGGLAPVVRDSPGPRVPPGGDARAIGWLAVGSHARRHGRRRATQRVPRRTRARAGSDDPRRNRFELAAEAIRRSPRLVAPALQRTGGRPRARQTSSPSERPGPIRRPSPPPARRPTDRRSIPKDRSVGGAVVPRSPPVGWCPAARAEALAAATCRSAPRASSSRSPRMLSHRARRSAPGVPPR